MTDFQKGVRAMFDSLLTMTANNYHANKKINKVCENENEIVERFAEDALCEVDENSYTEWKEITKLQREIREIKFSSKF